RVSFIRTLLTGGEILLLDEPFSALDALTKTSLQEWLFEQWQEWEKTILFITHDVEEALFLSNRVLVVEQQPITTLTERTVPLDHNRT
ncbi:ABC transporter ATP-binding protein, partial [Acinetobacter baumannii]|nr:ABC transporter ATP-binding protein [Acinetobacter baumannii]